MARSVGCPYVGFVTHSLGYVRSGSNRTRRWPARVRIATDASPWGFGAWLEVDRQPKEFISEAWTDEDCKYFGHERGSSDGQQTWEALVVLLAIRVWLPEYRDEKLKLVILSDSKATLAVVGKERSKSTRLNTIARELSLDLAQNSHVLELQTCHVAGTENQWAVECMNPGKRTPCQVS